MQVSYRPSHHPIALIAPREEKQGEAALQRETGNHVSGKRPPWPGSPSRTATTNNNQQQQPRPCCSDLVQMLLQSILSLSLPLPTEGSVTLLNAHQREKREPCPIIHLPILPFALICCLFFIFPSLLCIRASQLLHVHDHGVEEGMMAWPP